MVNERRILDEFLQLARITSTSGKERPLAAARNLHFPARLVSSGGGSDANIFNNLGIACANLGIGMKKVHTTEEFIKVEDLVNIARLLLEIIRLAKEVDS